MLGQNNLPKINDNATDEELKKMMEELFSEDDAIDFREKNIEVKGAVTENMAG